MEIFELLFLMGSVVSLGAIWMMARDAFWPLREATFTYRK